MSCIDKCDITEEISELITKSKQLKESGDKYIEFGDIKGALYSYSSCCSLLFAVKEIYGKMCNDKSGKQILDSEIKNPQNRSLFKLDENYNNMLSKVDQLLKLVKSDKNSKDDSKNISCKEVKNEVLQGENCKFFEHVIGLHEQKEQIIETFIKPIIYPTLYGEISKGILFYGPPGTGKTLLVKAAANTLAKKYIDDKISVIFFSPTAADLKGKYVGESEKKIKELFTCAHRKACECQENDADGKTFLSVIFIDEIDNVGGNRSNDPTGMMKQTVNALLQAIDGVESNKNVMVMAATNNPWELDSALLRRFTSTIFVNLPESEDIKKLIELEIKRYITRKVVDNRTLSCGSDLNDDEDKGTCESQCKMDNLTEDNKAIIDKYSSKYNVLFSNYDNLLYDLSNKSNKNMNSNSDISQIMNSSFSQIGSEALKGQTFVKDILDTDNLNVYITAISTKKIQSHGVILTREIVEGDLNYQNFNQTLFNNNHYFLSQFGVKKYATYFQNPFIKIGDIIYINLFFCPDRHPILYREFKNVKSVYIESICYREMVKLKHNNYSFSDLHGNSIENQYRNLENCKILIEKEITIATKKEKNNIASIIKQKHHEFILFYLLFKFFQIQKENEIRDPTVTLLKTVYINIDSIANKGINIYINIIDNIITIKNGTNEILKYVIDPEQIENLHTYIETFYNDKNKESFKPEFIQKIKHIFHNTSIVKLILSESEMNHVQKINEPINSYISLLLTKLVNTSEIDYNHLSIILAFIMQRSDEIIFKLLDNFINFNIYGENNYNKTQFYALEETISKDQSNKYTNHKVIVKLIGDNWVETDPVKIDRDYHTKLINLFHQLISKEKETKVEKQAQLNNNELFIIDNDKSIYSYIYKLNNESLNKFLESENNNLLDLIAKIKLEDSGKIYMEEKKDIYFECEIDLYNTDFNKIQTQYGLITKSIYHIGAVLNDIMDFFKFMMKFIYDSLIKIFIGQETQLHTNTDNDYMNVMLENINESLNNMFQSDIVHMLLANCKKYYFYKKDNTIHEVEINGIIKNPIGDKINKILRYVLFSVATEVVGNLKELINKLNIKFDFILNSSHWLYDKINRLSNGFLEILKSIIPEQFNKYLEDSMLGSFFNFICLLLAYIQNAFTTITFKIMSIATMSNVVIPLLFLGLVGSWWISPKLKLPNISTISISNKLSNDRLFVSEKTYNEIYGNLGNEQNFEKIFNDSHYSNYQYYVGTNLFEFINYIIYCAQDRKSADKNWLNRDIVSKITQNELTDIKPILKVINNTLKYDSIDLYTHNTDGIILKNYYINLDLIRINIQNKKSIINKNEYNDLIEYSKNPQKVIKKRTVSI